MTCFFAQDPLACLVGLVPAPILWAAGIALALFLLGLAVQFRQVLALIHTIAGWPGVAAVSGFITFVIWYVFLRPRGAPRPQPKNPDGTPVASAPARPRKRRTLADVWREIGNRGGT